MNELEPKANNPIIQCIEGVRGYVDADGVTPKEKLLRLQAAFPEFVPKLPPEAFPDEED